jgi:hypothetical protein
MGKRGAAGALNVAIWFLKVPTSNLLHFHSPEPRK